jgi:hypothetical protein
MLSWDLNGGYPCKNGDVEGEGIHYRSIYKVDTRVRCTSEDVRGKGIKKERKRKIVYFLNNSS